MQTNMPESPETKHSQSKLTCKQCKKGVMIPAIEEGDPEYTDNFICTLCNYRDTIPTKGLLFSQLLTAASGISICIYLLIEQLSSLFRAMQHDSLHNTLQTSSLIFLAGLFLSGFIYIFFRAQDGFRYRRLYTHSYNKDGNRP